MYYGKRRKRIEIKNQNKCRYLTKIKEETIKSICVMFSVNLSVKDFVKLLY